MATTPGVHKIPRQFKTGDTGDVVSTLGRTGYAAKAFVYTIIGLLVARLAFGRSSEEASAEGAFDTLAQQPFGMWLVGLTGAGLATYALWRFAMIAMSDTDDEDSLPGWVHRGGWVVSALSNSFLAWLALQKVLGQGGSSGSSKSTGRFLELPGGVVLVGLAGIAVIGFGIDQGRKSATGSWTDRLDFSAMTTSQRNITIALGKAGHAGRALAWSITGGFLLQAAITFDPNEPVGLDAALREVQQSAWGLPVLLAVAVGLAAYGLWCGTVTLWGDPDA